ncbi:hypothetical protein HGK25_27545 (plasmid) [Klebsiella pneumoniae]|nr:hypothetical protein HGK25_27545 [Klebsiella pneumoniae]
MKGLLLLLGAGGGWQLWQSETGEGLRADYRTPKAQSAVSNWKMAPHAEYPKRGGCAF